MTSPRRPKRLLARVEPLEGRELLSSGFSFVSGPSSTGERQSFHYEGGQTNYTLVTGTGSERTTQSYALDIVRIRDSAPAGLRASEAIQAFAARLAVETQSLANGTTPDFSGLDTTGYTVARENIRNNGGAMVYDLTIDSGPYEFVQRYEITPPGGSGVTSTNLSQVSDDASTFRTDFRALASKAVPHGAGATGGSTSGSSGSSGSGGSGGSTGTGSASTGVTTMSVLAPPATSAAVSAVASGPSVTDPTRVGAGIGG